jgi:hypothetical protein
MIEALLFAFLLAQAPATAPCDRLKDLERIEAFLKAEMAAADCPSRGLALYRAEVHDALEAARKGCREPVASPCERASVPVLWYGFTVAGSPCAAMDAYFGWPPAFRTVDEYGKWAALNNACYEEQKAAKKTANHCARADELAYELLDDNTALLTGGGMPAQERAKVEAELGRASAACKESGK